MSNPFLTRTNNRDKGHHGRSAEKRLSVRVQGQLQPGSGALQGAKGDVKKDTPTRQVLMESKATLGKSMTLQRDWLFKVYQEALEQNRIPALAFTFVDEAGNSEKRERWVAIPEHFWIEMIEGE